MGTRLPLALGFGLILCGNAAAQVVPPGVTPGQVQRQVQAPPQPQLPPNVVSPPPSPGVATAPKSTVRFKVASVDIEGSTVFSPKRFQPLIGRLVGRKASFSDLAALRDAITALYRSRGYLLARAFIPPQTFSSDGAQVKIGVVEGYIDRVEWRGSFPRFIRRTLNAFGARIAAERPARRQTIERNLLLANDLPGYEGRFHSTLVPSTSNPGAATLVVDLAAPPRHLGGEAGVDNRGAAGLGPWEFEVDGTAKNLLGLHESIGLRFVGATDLSQLQYYEATYHQLLSPNGLSLDLKGSYDVSAPGLPSLRTIGYKGYGDDFEGGLSYPIFRTRAQSLSVTLDGFADNLESKVLGGQVFSRDRLRGVLARGEYDFSYQAIVAQPAATLAQATVSQGVNGLGSTSNDNPLASRTIGRVDFTKIEFLVSRQQALDELRLGATDLGQLSAKVAVYGQYSFEPLLTAEQCGFGGRYFGRGLDASSLTGDQCWMESAELQFSPRWRVSLPAAPQLYAFVDHGEAWNLKASSDLFRREIATTTGAGVRLGGPFNTLLLLEARRSFSSFGDGWRGSLEFTVRY